MSKHTPGPRQAAQRLARKLGATITGSAEGKNGVEAEAPAGYAWKCEPGLHVLVSAPWDGDTPADVWRDLWERMDLGVEPCDCCAECTQARAEGRG